MTDLEYIVKQAKKFYFTQWDEAELRKCVDMLPNLSKHELTALPLNKWTKEATVLRESILNILFKDQIGKLFSQEDYDPFKLVKMDGNRGGD